MDASLMSCQVMTELAIDEARRNRILMEYQTVYPACERFQELADRGKESELQKQTQFARKTCFIKKPTFDQGDYYWEPEHPRAQFDAWTKAKYATKFK